MHSWLKPKLPEIRIPASVTVGGTRLQDEVSLYVCGITPYDATHFGHAHTYLTFDYLVRVLHATGTPVRYVQNVTDIDDPLLERATETGVDWRDLAVRETDLFREDMEALRVLPPDHYVGAVETIPSVVTAVRQLLDDDAAYWVERDVYAALEGAVTVENALEVFAERGGDPGRAGKRDPLDPLLWLAERPGEPSWDGGVLGPGRPGWHIECAVIAGEFLGRMPTITGGGRDLAFPHHPMSCAHLNALGVPGASAEVHVGMVGYEGHKMSKSRGNLVKVSQERERGVDPRIIRLSLAEHHYSEDFEWYPEDLVRAGERLARWSAAAERGADSGTLAEDLVTRLADDLDLPGALVAIDRWAAGSSGDASPARAAIDALLGIPLP